MKITLKIDGHDKTYVNDFVSGRMLRETLKYNDEVAKKREKGDYPITEQLDDLAELTVKAFNHQFTFDELWDGIEANNIQSELLRIFNEILGLGGYELRGDSDEGK